MSIFTSRPALRWGVPVVVFGAVIGGGAAARTLGASADPSLAPGGYMDAVLRGPGYPEPVIPAALGFNNDRFAKMKHWMDDMRAGRSNERLGWMRIDV